MVHQACHPGQQPRPALDANIETAPGSPTLRQTLKKQRIGVRRQAGVGVQEQQHTSLRRGGAGVHLARAPARRADDLVGICGGQGRRAVKAAAIDDDELGAARAQRCQRLQKGCDAGRFVENRHDDGQLHRLSAGAANAQDLVQDQADRAQRDGTVGQVEGRKVAALEQR